MITSRVRILALALSNLSRHWARTTVIVLVYSLLVCLVVSVLLYVKALDHHAHLLLEEAPEIVIQRMVGGRHELIPVSRADEILRMRGVKAVKPRVWGYSYDPPTETTFTFWGAASVPRSALAFGEGRFPMDGEGQVCIVGNGIADIRFLGLGDRLPIKGADGRLFAPRVIGIFRAESDLLANDLVVMPTGDLREVFGMADTVCTDISIEVHNPLEIDTIARKISLEWSDVRVITRHQILQTYDAVFDWRGSVWIGWLLPCVLAFAILVWDKATGLSAEEVRTIGILKAIGWSTRDVLHLRFWEGLVVSVTSVLTGLCAAELHFAVLGGRGFAPLLKGWSVLYPDFQIVPVLDAYVLAVCGLCAVAPYLLAGLIPSWRASIVDPDTLVRG